MTTFKTYVAWINDLYKDNPELKEVQVITSADDEGNYFNPVLYKPCTGKFENDEFISYNEHNKINAICLN